MATPQNYNCPECGLPDRVEKVSAVVGSSTSALSQKLFPLVKPVYETPYGGGTKFAIGFCMFLFIGSFINIAQGQRNEQVFFGGIVSTILLVVILALILFFKERTAKKRHDAVDAAMTRYNAAYKKWDQLYYCARNDVVFIPRKPGTCVPSSEIQKLL